MTKRIVALAAAAASVWTGAPPAAGTNLVRMDVRALALSATSIVRARCLAVASRPDAGSVSTFTTFQTLERWKGPAPQQFTLRLPGGEAAGFTVRVEGAPRFFPGEEVVLFLARTRSGDITIVSWAQGTFRIRMNPLAGVEEALQDTGGLTLLDGHSPRGSAGARRNLSLAVLRAQVARSLAERPQ